MCGSQSWANNVGYQVEGSFDFRCCVNTAHITPVDSGEMALYDGSRRPRARWECATPKFPWQLPFWACSAHSSSRDRWTVGKSTAACRTLWEGHDSWLAPVGRRKIAQPCDCGRRPFCGHYSNSIVRRLPQPGGL